MKKKMVVLCMICAMTISSIAGCGKDTVTRKDTDSVPVQKENEEDLRDVTFGIEDLKEVISGIEDRYVVKDSKDIDFLKAVEYDDKIIEDVKVDSSNVDIEKVGTYKLTYDIWVKEAALREYLETLDNAEDNDSKKAAGSTKESDNEKNTDEVENAKSENKDSDAKDADKDSTDESEETMLFNIEKKVMVVSKDDAQELADAGKEVWTDKNELVAKKEDAKEKTEEKKDAKEETSKTEKKKEAASSDDAKKDSGSSNAGSGTAQNNSNSGNSNGDAGSSPAPAEEKTEQPSTSQPSTAPVEQKPEQPSTSQPSAPENPEPEPVHVHNWILQTEAWDEPVYEYHTVCTCGYDFTVNGGEQIEYHLAELGHSYGTQSVQTGTIHHDAVYVCSECGAIM